MTQDSNVPTEPSADIRDDLRASLALGLEQSAAGMTKDLGDFTQFVDDVDA